MYGESNLRCTLVNGADVSLQQTTSYPWDGDVALKTKLTAPARFVLSLRIPHWAEGATLRINGETVDLSTISPAGYARIDREWTDGDEVALLLPLTLRPQYANPKVRQDAGRVAFMRGPLVYCAEEVDNGGDLNAIVVPKKLPEARTEVLADLNDAVAVDLAVEREDISSWGEALYRSSPAERSTANIRLVPFHLWDNRAPGSMLVWLQAEK